MKDNNFSDHETRSLDRGDLGEIIRLEEEIYAKDELIQGKRLIDDIESGNGFDYSVVLVGKGDGGEKELLGYAIGVEDKTDKGEPCIYLEDIAVSQKVRGRGLGWVIMKEMIGKIKVKLKEDGESLLLSMHLRESSKRLLDKHKEDLEALGLRRIDEVLVPGYYSKNENALYRIYETIRRWNTPLQS
ncbi:MAG: GNAT family N-acetyltransferase [Candidatus Paceibacterota bacterium]|jgi:ribosomal protein S18 acetylase RimI-like enzyme